MEAPFLSMCRRDKLSISPPRKEVCVAEAAPDFLCGGKRSNKESTFQRRIRLIASRERTPGGK
jgi:hypothetical protein